MGRCLSKMCSKCRCSILGYFLIRVADHWGNTELLWTLILHTLITRAYAHWLKRGGAKFKNHSCPPIRAIWIFVIVFVLKEALSERIFYDYRLPIPACRNSPFWFHPCVLNIGRRIKILGIGHTYRLRRLPHSSLPLTEFRPVWPSYKANWARNGWMVP